MLKIVSEKGVSQVQPKSGQRNIVKPIVQIIMYNKNTSGVDLIDQFCSSYPYTHTT